MLPISLTDAANLILKKPNNIKMGRFITKTINERIRNGEYRPKTISGLFEPIKASITKLTFSLFELTIGCSGVYPFNVSGEKYADAIHS